MEGDGRKMICDRCHKAVPLADVKYLPKGNNSKMALCSACRQQTLPESSIGKSSGSKPAREKRPEYFCGRCRFKFKYKGDAMTNFKCPYCGKADKVVEYKANSADDLVQSATYD
jgi:protein-arginine kinase activator protein McsA